VIHTGHSKIPNYKTLSEGYLQGLTREEMLFKFGIKDSMDLKKISKKNIIKLKIIRFYIVADAVKGYYNTYPNNRIDKKFMKKLVAKKTGYSEHSCTVTISSLIDAGLKPEICQVEQETGTCVIS
jgi:hypothetical protein